MENKLNKHWAFVIEMLYAKVSFPPFPGVFTKLLWPVKSGVIEQICWKLTWTPTVNEPEFNDTQGLSEWVKG